MLSKIGRYELRGELGRGGMGSVYRAFDPNFKREVALKVLPREFLHEAEFRARFQREAEIIARLEHPAIVPVYDYGEEDGQPYIVMRLMSGGTLAERLARGPLSPEETGQLLARIAPALDKAHGQGIIHRDLKPANILFDDERHPYISDFGLAKMLERGTQLSGSQIMGTPAYMSPEQARGDKSVDARADLYALGAIVFQMLTGKVPFDADTPVGVVVKHITDPPPKLTDTRPDLPQAFDSVIERAMAKDPAARYPNARTLVQDVHAAAQGQPMATRSAGALPGPTAMPPTRPMPAVPASTPAAAPPDASVTWRRWLPWLVGCGAMTVVAVIALTSLGALGLFLSRETAPRQLPTPVAAGEDETATPRPDATDTETTPTPDAFSATATAAAEAGVSLGPNVTIGPGVTVGSGGSAENLFANATLLGTLEVAPASSPGGTLVLVAYWGFDAPDPDRNRGIAAVAADSGDLVWRSEWLATGDAEPVLVSHGSVVATFDGADAVGLSLVDGRETWRITLLDVGVDMRRLGDQLVALAADGTVTGLDTETGGMLWNDTVLEGEAGSLIPFGARVAVADNDGGDDFYRLFSPDGSSVEWRPSCVDRGASFGSLFGPWLRPIAGSPDIAVVYSFSQTCVQRVNLDTLEEVWTARPSGSPFGVSVSAFNARIVATADWVLYPNGDGDIVGIRVADGTASVVAADEEYALAPITAVGDLLLVSAREDRGTPSAEAWAIDAATGDRRWQLPLGDSVPYDQPADWLVFLQEDIPLWITRLVDEQVTVFALVERASGVEIEAYRGPLATGPTDAPLTSSLGSAMFNVSPPVLLADGERGSWLLFNGRLWRMDHLTGEIVPLGR